MSNLTLLQQARIEKLHRRLEEIESRGKSLSGSELIQMLLPRYEIIHTGKPIMWNGISHPDGDLKAWHDATQIEKGIKGGERSGKTYPIMAEDIMLSFVNRPEYHLSVSPSFDNACETVIEVLKLQCDNNNLSYDWYKSNNLFLIYWGKKEEDIARILIHGQDSNWLGVTAASGDLNEPFSMVEETYKDWCARISSPRAKILRRLWGGTALPDTMQWGHKYFKESQTVTDKLYTDTIVTYGNKYLPFEYIDDRDKSYGSRDKNVRLLGKCIQLAEGDAVYYVYDFERHVRQLDYFEPGMQFVLSFDFNVKPMTALLGSVAPAKIRILDNFKIWNSSSSELCEAAIITMQNQKLLREDGYMFNGSVLIITGDASGEADDTRSKLTDYNYIMRKLNEYGVKYKFVVPLKNPAVSGTITDCNTALQTNKCLVDIKCEDFHTTLGNTAYKKGSNGLIINEQTEWGHQSACFRYLVHNTKPIHERIPNTSPHSGSYVQTREDRWG